MKNKKPIYWIVLALYCIASINLFTWLLNLTKFYWFSWAIFGLFVFFTTIHIIALRQDKKKP